MCGLSLPWWLIRKLASADHLIQFMCRLACANVVRQRGGSVRWAKHAVHPHLARIPTVILSTQLPCTSLEHTLALSLFSAHVTPSGFISTFPPLAFPFLLYCSHSSECIFFLNIVTQRKVVRTLIKEIFSLFIYH